MGSGEMARAMSKVHRWIVSKIEGPVKAVFLDTPAGFELNADEIAERARAYVTEYVRVPCSIVSFRSAEGATAREVESAVRKLKRADYIFAGPGSPTYAARNWRDTPVFAAMAERISRGAHLVLASAAAIAMGRFALPVYEIYKVGEAPHWVDGLDLLAPYGLELAIVTHWNNVEGGTFDTRYCYMGQPRFGGLEKSLPASTVVLGIDEYTACVIDLGADECRVMGAGGVTIRRSGRETRFDAGGRFGLDSLRTEPTARRGRKAPRREDASAAGAAKRARDALLQQAEEAQQDIAAARPSADLSFAAGDIYELAQALDEARDAGVDDGLVSQARENLRQLLVAWSDRLAPSAAESVASIAPFVELLIDVRSRLRDARNWALADEIRDRLAALGVVLEDSADGTAWRRHEEE
jgi:hypothetical protein